MGVKKKSVEPLGPRPSELEIAKRFGDKKVITAFGETKTYAMWAEDYRVKPLGITSRHIANRVDSYNWPAGKALTTPINNKVPIFGEEKTITQWSKDPRCKVTKAVLYNRLNELGWPGEAALTAPAHGWKKPIKQKSTKQNPDNVEYNLSGEFILPDKKLLELWEEVKSLNKEVKVVIGKEEFCLYIKEAALNMHSPVSGKKDYVSLILSNKLTSK